MSLCHKVFSEEWCITDTTTTTTPVHMDPQTVRPPHARHFQWVAGSTGVLCIACGTCHRLGICINRHGSGGRETPPPWQTTKPWAFRCSETAFSLQIPSSTFSRMWIKIELLIDQPRKPYHLRSEYFWPVPTRMCIKIVIDFEIS